ncbi:MAG: ORF6N domain-containing protein [Paludibacteraceae bacterium]|nr:ORF6N domain-containing protein [Paludibacteraceae bacterium]
MELQLIQQKIYQIRGQRVMIDRDLAEMYGVETRVLNQAVKRNIERFPEDFMFQLTQEEREVMSSQIVMTSKSKRPNSSLPLVFTEHGVTMLSSVLRSSTAIQVNIQIVRAFVAIRNLILQKPVGRIEQVQHEMSELKIYLDEIFTDQNDINEDTRLQIELINQSLAELQADKSSTKRPRRKIGYIQDEE